MKVTVLCLGFALALASLATRGLAAERSPSERASINRRTGLYETPLSDLRKATERGDRVELARVAGRLGPARLARALADADRRIVLAALDAAPLLDSGALLLENVVPLAWSADEAVRHRSVRTLAALLGQIDANNLAEWELSTETTQVACQALVRVAANEDEKLAPRLDAAQGLADAAALCSKNPRLAALLGSKQPEIRRAALWLVPTGSEVEALRAATKDKSGLVAAAAGARLCRQRKPEAKNAVPADPPFGQLALAEGALPEDLVEMLPCLVGSTQAADRKAVEELQKTGPSAARDEIKKLLEKSPGR